MLSFSLDDSAEEAMAVPTDEIRNNYIYIQFIEYYFSSSTHLWASLLAALGAESADWIPRLGPSASYQTGLA